ncbi:restriction endonuclease subunit S [Elizabethkingia occulta]|uniref:Type I restriction modification DNA specificity domain-containing protein n=1 Tax=Elizabethkingia occulta TaxID=1867263 RepID=A0A1T3MNT6_9FLAO|nr:restriction endonuclease subunit S [Elizabethkingia occulta]OPC66224.1 hypothetical protein BAZ10_03080 [Elizabethkingia occulta]
MKRYDRYKDSGVDWIGEIPEKWQCLNFRQLIDVLTDFTANGSFGDLAKNVTYIDDVSYSKLIRLTDLRKNLENGGIYIDEKSHKYLKKSELFGGELLIANVGAYAGLCCIMPDINYKASLGPNMFLLKLNNILLINYTFYLINSSKYWQWLQITALSSAQPKLNKENIRQLKVILPPLPEQQTIASFLDDKTAKIDQTIFIKEKEIELLKERRQILIQKAVTKGLDDKVKFKDSGVEWVGEIPEHWKVMRLKYVFKILKRIAGREGYNILSITQRGIKIKDISNGEGQIASDYSNYQFCNKGEFAMNHMDLLTGWVDITKYDGVISPDYRVFQSILPNANKKYLLQLLQLCYSNKAFYANGQGVSMLGRWRFPTENFNNFSFPIPSNIEQVKIVAYLEKIEEKISKAISLKQQEIEKLKEYKTVLIDNVVTGKLKVS